MTDYFLKFLDEAQAKEVMAAFTYPDEKGVSQWNMGGHQWALWPLPTIEGVEGYYVNLRMIDESIDVSYLEPYMVHPQNPKCVWA